MNKKHAFWAYAVVSALLIVLARQNWHDFYLSVPQMWQLSFGFIKEPLKLALLCISTLFFDYTSIILPRSEINGISNFLVIRKTRVRALAAELAPRDWQYLLPFIGVHLFALAPGNLGNSLWVLALMVAVWLFLLLFPAYRWPLLLQNVLVFAVLLGVRLVLYKVNA